MADFYGALTLPVPVPGAGQSIGDPALDAIGAYLSAVLTSYLQTAWSSVSPGMSVVQTLFKCSPEDGQFQKEDLPALFVWPSETRTARIADDWVEKTTTISILWVTRPADQPFRLKRAPVFNAVAGVISSSLERGCDPAWVVSGDPDPLSATRGSLLQVQAGWLRRPHLDSAKPQSITIQIDESQARPYWAVSASITSSELLEFFADNYVNAWTPPALTADVNDSTGRTLVEIQKP